MMLSEDIRQLSSGTIATLSNLTHYDDIDTLRESLVKQVQQWLDLGVLEETDPWEYAWNLYKLNHDFHTNKRKVTP